MSARIYTGAEAAALREGTTPGPWAPERKGSRIVTSMPRKNIAVTTICGERDVDIANTALVCAAPDLAASVEHHAARADELSAECVKLRVAWVRETHRSDDATARADAAEAALAAAHARIADLERLAAGPRTPAVDDGLARPFAPETLPGWDADGREVGR